MAAFQPKASTSLITKKPKESENALATSTQAVNISLDRNFITIANQTDFSYIIKETVNRLLVVEFFAKWCGPCQALSAKLDELAQVYDGKILIVKVDVDEFEELTLEFNISAIPTFIIMKNQKKVQQFASSNVQTLEKTLEKYAGKPLLNATGKEIAKEKNQSAREQKEKF